MKRCPVCNKEMDYFELFCNGGKQFAFWKCNDCKIWEDHRENDASDKNERNDKK